MCITHDIMVGSSPHIVIGVLQCVATIAVCCSVLPIDTFNSGTYRQAPNDNSR